MRGVLLLLIGVVTGSIVFTAAGAHGNAGRSGAQAIVPGVTGNLSGATISREPMPAVSAGNQPIGAPTPRPHPSGKVTIHVPPGPWPERLANDINHLPGWNTSMCSLPAGPGYYLYEISFQYESDRWTVEVDRSAHEHVFPRYAGGPPDTCVTPSSASRLNHDLDAVFHRYTHISMHDRAPRLSSSSSPIG
jgi:hypothetical protein